MTNCVAIIPARGGSKRIPRKNVRNFCGQPLISYSIKTALKSKLFNKVIVSTDDIEIAEIARKYGAEVPFIRPNDLSDDYSTTQDVVEHCIEFLKRNGEDYDYFCTIYATAPFLNSKYLLQGFNAINSNNMKYAFSATSMPFPIQRTFKITDSNRCEMFWPENFPVRSQDLEESYQDAGQFYWENINLNTSENLFGLDSTAIVLPRYLVQDIDTEEDWVKAEIMFKVITELNINE